MPLQYNDDDGDLFDDDGDDEDGGEGLASDQPSPLARRVASAARAVATHEPRSMAQAAASRRMRVRPMTPAMASKNPQVVSIILTRADGKQLVFIRK